jgi:shikimate kinase
MSTVLLGYRGCGKTTIGKKLADRMWQKFIDTDQMVSAAAGKSIREIFEQHGEAHFRELETEALARALAMEDHVIAVGGGAVLKPRNRELFLASSTKRVYLKCDPETLLKRILADPESLYTRPALTDHAGSIEEVTTHLAEREPLYRQVKTAEVEVSNLTPQEAVVYIARLI